MLLLDSMVMQVERVDAPVDPSLLADVKKLWIQEFDEEAEDCESVYGASEVQKNRDVLYVVRERTRLVGVSHLTVSEMDRRVGGVGGVVTAPAHRRRGIGSANCRQLRQDFFDGGGHALFLGTHNPAARRVYERLGWQEIEGTNVMGALADAGSVDYFLNNYFARSRAVVVRTGSARERVTIIPLLMVRHKWQVLDINVGFFSTGCAHQKSCMGLYWRMSRSLRKDRRGTWWAAYTDRGCLVGLSTVRMDGPTASVDGFAHEHFLACLPDLLETACRWARDQGAITVDAQIAEVDGQKRELFETMAFGQAKKSTPRVCGDRKLAILRLVRDG